MVPWISQQGWVQVSLPLLSAHTGTCPASNHWPEPQNILSWRGPPSCGCECECVDQLLQQSKFIIKQHFELTHLCVSEAVILGGIYIYIYELGLKNLAGAEGREGSSLSLRNAFDRDSLSPHLLAGNKLHLSCKWKYFSEAQQLQEQQLVS